MKYMWKDGFTITDELDVIVDELTTHQQVVGIFQGDSEIGPRALGNRSLLFNPTNCYAKDIMNTIKKREWYRPFAGSIMLDYAHDWFEMGTLEESPWMTYAIQSKEIAKRRVPSIVHVDGTCRIQTVTEEQNPYYYKLIKKFHERILTEHEDGCPIIFNTSFNLKGEAIVETLEDAMKTCEDGGIQFLYVPAWEDDELELPEEYKNPMKGIYHHLNKNDTLPDVEDSEALKNV